MVKDQGPGYDIDNIRLPDFHHHPEGGFGIFSIKLMMDKVEYFQKGGFNNLKMFKSIEYYTNCQKFCPLFPLAP